ncbi:MAG: DUF1996 domain-containing protein [Actinomycetota bacterium]
MTTSPSSATRDGRAGPADDPENPWTSAWRAERIDSGGTATPADDPHLTGGFGGRRDLRGRAHVEGDGRVPHVGDDQWDDQWEDEAGPAGFGYKLGLLIAVGIAILAVTSLAQPSRTFDDLQTRDLDDTERAGVAAVETGGAELESRSNNVIVIGGDQPSVVDQEAAGPDTTVAAEPVDGPPADTLTGDYRSNLDLILAGSVRNTNHDDSPWIDTPSDQLDPANHYGPRSEYLNNPGGNPEQAFPVPNGGQFRAGCEFSHFTYDDPLLFPGRPGASHLHMHFGNTHINAFSTGDSVKNSGSSTCNGQELNRTGYWVPAMFDAQGNVRIPERVVVYYKGEGLARGAAQVYPDGAAMIATKDLNNPNVETQGGSVGKYTYACSNNFSGGVDQGGGVDRIPVCDGNFYKNLYGVDDNPRVVLEMNVKFPQCWNGQDPTDWRNFSEPAYGGWYGSNCTGEFNQTFVNLEYFVNYVVELGESTEGWYLSSDVDPTTFGASKQPGGSTVHGDWWAGWHTETNQMWIDNCVNYANPSGAPSGCGFGYLTDGGADNTNPGDGPALKYRPQYTGPNKVPAETLFRELCPAPDRSFTKPEDAAYCRPE